MREAIRLDAAAVVPKSAAKVACMEAVDQIMQGSMSVHDVVASTHGATEEPPSAAARLATLTPTQLNRLAMIKRGNINKQVASDVGIGDSMVKVFVSEIMRELGMRNRTPMTLCATALDFDRVGI